MREQVVSDAVSWILNQVRHLGGDCEHGSSSSQQIELYMQAYTSEYFNGSTRISWWAY